MKIKTLLLQIKNLKQKRKGRKEIMSNRRVDMDMTEYEESYQTREGKRYRGYFMDESSIPLWTPGKGEHIIDILPYRVGPLDPRVRMGSIKEGKWVYKLDFFVHNKIGISDLTHICLKDSYMIPCPVHEEIEKIKRQGDFDDKALKALYSKRRNLFNVWVHDNETEEKKGPQVLDISHFHLEQKLIKIAKRRKGGGFIPFSDPDDGCLILFERTGVGATNTGYDGYRFEQRDRPIPDEILKQVICLDSLLYVPTYEEIKRLLQGGEPIGARGGLMDDESSEEDVPDSPSGPPRAPRSYESPQPVVTRDKCYGGGKFGKSFRQTDGCGECGIYAECAAEFNREDVSS